MAWLRATVSRFADGETHARRRAMVEARLAALDPARAARRGAPSRTTAVCRARVPPRWRCWPRRPASTATCVVDDVRTVAAAYHPGTDAPGADEALPRLLDRLPPGAEEALAQHVALLVQACEATAALSAAMICPCSRRSVSTPDGNVIVVDLDRTAVRRRAPALPRARARAGARGGGARRFADLHQPGDPLLLPERVGSRVGARRSSPPGSRRSGRPASASRRRSACATGRRVPEATRALAAAARAPAGATSASTSSTGSPRTRTRSPSTRSNSSARRRRHQPRGPQRRPDPPRRRDRRRQGRDEPVRQRAHRHVLARRRNRNRASAARPTSRRAPTASSCPASRTRRIEALADLGAPLNVLFGPGTTVERLPREASPGSAPVQRCTAERSAPPSKRRRRSAAGKQPAAGAEL